MFCVTLSSKILKNGRKQEINIIKEDVVVKLCLFRPMSALRMLKQIEI